MYEPPRYWNFGHDNAKSLFDIELARTREPCENLFFGGIGDGRNLYATLISIASHERSTAKHSKYHITINDINPHPIARLLVFLKIFAEMAKAKPEEEVMFLTTLYYLFASAAMPPCIFDIVDTTIRNIITMLDEGATVIAGLDVRSCRSSVVKVLKSWRNDAPTYFPISLIFNEHIKSQNLPDAITLEDWKAHPLKGEQEHTFFHKTGAILAPHLVLNEEKEIVHLLKEMGTFAVAMRSYLAQKWKPNVTIFDLDWLKVNPSRFSINLAFDPFVLADKFYSKISRNQGRVVLLEGPLRTLQLYDYIVPFFRNASKAWSQFNGKLAIEVLMGDVIDVFEDFQHGILESRPDNYPKQFDRIHMTNIQS